MHTPKSHVFQLAGRTLRRFQDLLSLEEDVFVRFTATGFVDTLLVDDSQLESMRRRRRQHLVVGNPGDGGDSATMMAIKLWRSKTLEVSSRHTTLAPE